MVTGKSLQNISVGISLPKACNIKHLHERWRTFSFDPANDDIEEYIRDVKEAAKQLGHGDDAMVNSAQGHHANRIVWHSLWS